MATLPAMVGRIFLAAACLVLPLAALLFAQWPLRDLVQAYSRQANDAAQVLFALAMAFGVTQASRAGTHLVAGHGRRSGRFVAFGVAVCVVPWALFLLVEATPVVWNSVKGLEKFSDTLTPGFFVIRIALWLLLAMALLHALVGAWRALAGDA